MPLVLWNVDRTCSLYKWRRNEINIPGARRELKARRAEPGLGSWEGDSEPSVHRVGARVSAVSSIPHCSGVRVKATVDKIFGAFLVLGGAL